VSGTGGGLRTHAGVRLLIALNFSAVPQILDLSSAAEQGEVQLSTELDRRGTEGLAQFNLRANEGVILQAL
jgi:hypothetical protein